MSEDKRNARKSTILVVDDIPENLKLLVNLLQRNGYHVKPASNGQFALDSALRDAPDLILLDIMMPEIDGYDVCRQFKANERTRDIPIIFITAKESTESQTLGFQLGAVDYITKPFQPDIVLARVRTQLELKQHRNNLEELVTERTEALTEEIRVRREAEENLRASEAKLSSIINTFHGFIYSTDPNEPYRITYANRSLIEHLGYDPTGKTCYEAIFGKQEPCSGCELKQLDQQEFVESEIRHPAKEIWYSAVHSAVKDDTDYRPRHQTILIDITRQKLAEQELKAKEEALRQENLRLKSSMKERYRFGNIIGRSKPMQEVYETILQAAARESFVSIYGESGTGKELVAKAIHEQSKRSNKKLVSVNCGAIPENLAESEFFGHKKGAFTGADKDKIGYLEEADGGTLFLDEVGQINLSLQIKLLRVLDGYGFTPVGDRKLLKPDLRIITATNQDLPSLVKNGTMREDFFYRIHVIPIKLPPLRQRKEDIPLLIEHFFNLFEAGSRLPLNVKIMEALQAHDWPGNVRELQNTLHRYITLGKLDLIGREISPNPQQEQIDEAVTSQLEGDLTAILQEVEKQLITKALNDNQWRRDKTASALGITQKTLYRRMKQFQLIE